MISFNFIHKLAVFGLIFCTLFVLLVGYWLIRPYHVLHINSFKVVESEVEAGEYLEYSLDYCKEKQYEFMRSEVQISFMDGVIYNLPIQSGPLAPGCATVLLLLHVPAIPEGMYHLEMVREFPVNPLRKIEIQAVSNVFKVSSKYRFERMLKQQLPKVIPKVIQEIPELR